MLDLQRTAEFTAWLVTNSDAGARGAILSRLDRFRAGNPGDVKPVGDGVSEMRINCGPGFRIYFCRIGAKVYLLLAGGGKRSQDKDIARAKALAAKAKDKP